MGDVPAGERERFHHRPVAVAGGIGERRGAVDGKLGVTGNSRARPADREECGAGVERHQCQAQHGARLVGDLIMHVTGGDEQTGLLSAGPAGFEEGR